MAATRGDAGRATRLFVWNCELSAAFWPAIALIEMAIRNAINTHLCKVVGLDAKTGWHTDALSDRPRIHLLDRDLDKLRSSVEAFRRRRETSGEPTGDDVVGGTSLGLWVALCGEGRPRGGMHDYHRFIWRGKKLWQAFPNYGDWLARTEQKKISPIDNPGPLRGALRDFELIRNRIAHHEPIYMISSVYHCSNIADLAEMIDTDLRRYIEHTDRVATVVKKYAPYVTGHPDLL
nr:CAAX protease [Nocardia bovistercoris]